MSTSHPVKTHDAYARLMNTYTNTTQSFIYTIVSSFDCKFIKAAKLKVLRSIHCLFMAGTLESNGNFSFVCVCVASYVNNRSRAESTRIELVFKLFSCSGYWRLDSGISDRQVPDDFRANRIWTRLKCRRSDRIFSCRIILEPYRSLKYLISLAHKLTYNSLTRANRFENVIWSKNWVVYIGLHDLRLLFYVLSLSLSRTHIHMLEYTLINHHRIVSSVQVTQFTFPS